MINRLKKTNRKVLLLCGLVFMLAFVLNLLTVPTSDDFPYSISNGIFDIFKLEIVQYMTWGGRSVAHVLARGFLSLPKMIFNIANSIVFSFTILLMYWHAKGGNEKESPILYAILACLVFVCSPMFGQTVLWETGSCNYLWTTMFILVFLLPYRLNDAKKSLLSTISFMLFGVLAGWSNENTGGACILITLLFLGYQLLYQRKKVQMWQILGLVGCVTGFVIMVLAPGNAIRALEFVQTENLLYTLTHDLTSVLQVIKTGFLFPMMLIIGFAVLTWFNSKNKDSIWDTTFYTVAGVAAVCAITISPVPVLWDRSMFGACIFVLIAAGVNIYQVDLINQSKKVVIWMLCGILLLITTLSYASATIDLFYTMMQSRQRDTYIQLQLSEGNKNPVVFQLFQEFITPYNPLYGLNDITPYSTFWLNKAYATVYGVESVQSTPLRIWQEKYQNGDSYLMNIQEYKEYIQAITSNSKYLVFINCSDMDEKYDIYKKELSDVGIDVNEYKNFIAFYQDGAATKLKMSNDGIDDFGKFDNKEFYLASYSIGNLCDIVIDEVEYTNNNHGINFVVFDLEKYRVVDSVTFNTDNGTRGIRYQEGD